MVEKSSLILGVCLHMIEGSRTSKDRRAVLDERSMCWGSTGKRNVSSDAQISSQIPGPLLPR